MPGNDVAFDLAADMDRPFAQGSIDGKRALDDLGCGLNATDDLDQRYEVRRVERVTDDETLWMSAARL